MSSYTFVNKEGREVRYGLDKPTGGYFYNEFYSDQEIEYDELLPESKQFSEALTLTELEKVLVSQYEFILSDGILERLCMDWINDPPPTDLQHNVNTMFGKNLHQMLLRVHKDILDISLQYK